jgi:two-component system, chemotaxis family, response regulator WspF
MRIAIVNDVVLAVEAMRRVVTESGQHEIAWTAPDGAAALERCARDTPDLVLMDLIMPRMDGVEATRRIMAASPCAILVVTANVTDHTSKVFEAMGAGALDAVNTPVLQSPASYEGASGLLAKVDTLGKLIGISAKRGGRLRSRTPTALPPRGRLVAIGASAGGPTALARILGGLPGHLPAPVVIVQHVDSQFAPGLAHWLASQTPLDVRLAQEGDVLQSGRVFLAGRTTHLVLTHRGRLGYSEQPENSSYRPSIDVFFQSVDRAWRGDVIAVLLTGMGRDGVAGLCCLHNRGHHTIAQDRATSAVYGMPRAAAEARAATEILPLKEIGPRILDLLVSRDKAHA